MYWQGEVQGREPDHLLVKMVSNLGHESLLKFAGDMMGLLDEKGCGQVGDRFTLNLALRIQPVPKQCQEVLDYGEKTY